MGRSQSIVIKNEYTLKTASGGSRGKTPGAYVTDYMSRPVAVEQGTPAAYDYNDGLSRFDRRLDMAQQAFIERTPHKDLLKSMRTLQGGGGSSFSNDMPSMSHVELLSSAHTMQDLFDSGKTVLKTVISFDEAYLKEKGIADRDFKLDGRGSYRGKIDQMRLRLAVMNGLELLSQEYDDLVYAGTIQVDTKHVHCHLAMSDMGEGNLFEDGTQKGKISKHAKNLIRAGIDAYLEESNTAPVPPASVTREDRSLFCSEVIHKTLQGRDFARLDMICAALPKDKRLWYGSNMNMAGKLADEYISGIFDEQGHDFDKHVAYKMANRIYDNISDYDLNHVHDSINDPVPRFVRNCRNAFNKNKKAYDRLDAYMHEYDERLSNGTATPDSKSVYMFLNSEIEYRIMLMSKYNAFAFLDYDIDFDDYYDIHDRRLKYNRMSDNDLLDRLSKSDPEYAEKCRREVYGENDINTRDAINMLEESKYNNLNERLLAYGMHMGVNPESLYDFNKIRAADAHLINNFVMNDHDKAFFDEITARRAKAYNDMYAWLEKKDRLDVVDLFKGEYADILKMHKASGVDVINTNHNIGVERTDRGHEEINNLPEIAYAMRHDDHMDYNNKLEMSAMIKNIAENAFSELQL